MNDEFLYRLRKEPPREFATRLKARLEVRSPHEARFSVVRSIVLGLLVGGSAIAATWWVAHVTRNDESQAAVAQAFESDSRASRQESPGSIGRPRSSVERAPFQDAGDIERVQGATSSARRSASSARADELVAGEAARSGGVIGGYAIPTGSASREPADMARHLFQVRAAGHESGMLFLEVVRRRMGNYALEIEAERVGDDEAFRRFCATEQADLIITTRAVAEDEMLRCTEKLNWRAKSIRATKLGHIGVVISAAKTATVQRLSPREIYLALAKRIPNPANPTRFIPNPNVSWHQVHGVGYREGRITFFGPERDSLLARVFAALILRAGCDTFPSIKALSDADPEQYHRICHEIREDSVYTPVYEGEFFLTQTLWGDPDALALLSLPFFDTHRTELNGSLLSGALPTKEAIASDAYEGAATLHLYVRGDKTGSTRLADELASERAIGPVGYLLSHGLIPLDTRGSLSPLNEPVP